MPRRRALQKEPRHSRSRTRSPATAKTNPVLLKPLEEPVPSRRPPRAHRWDFTARESILEIAALQSNGERFRGFYNLFWVFITFYAVVTIYHNYRLHGYLVTFGVLRSSFGDLWAFLLADLLMILYAFLAPLLQKAMLLGLVAQFLVPLIRQLLLSGLIFGAVLVALGRNWPAIQRGAFLLHAMTFYMKMHSYFVTNRELHAKYVAKAETGKVRAADSDAYPNNLTLGNYALFLCFPVIVYEPSYPRTPKVRMRYLFHKTCGIAALLIMLHITVEHYVWPVLYLIPTMSLLETVLQLLLPFILVYLLLFFVVFDCILNWFAEITRFADRQFYSDWWNSVTYAEFARKWNIPVHRFLQRHIYHESMQSYKLSRSTATTITFLFSSILHELIMTVISRRFHFFLLVLQMSQVPLIWLGSTAIVQENPIIANMFFWSGMMVGPPLISVVYCREYFMN